jgi:hypothetical protein
MTNVSPRGGRVSVRDDDDNEYVLPALLISGLKARIPHAEAWG